MMANFVGSAGDVGFLVACWQAEHTMRTDKLISRRNFMSKILSNFTWVDDIDDALNLVQQINNDSDYAIDTEFERSRTFYLNPALLQIKCDEQVYLVDIAIPDIAQMVFEPMKGIIL